LSAAGGAPDPRERRGHALVQLLAARRYLAGALEFLRESDPGSTVVDDAQLLFDKTQSLERMLEWRQGLEATP